MLEKLPLMLAPMATLTHPAFRTLVHEYGGCDGYFSEMISAEAFRSGTPFEYAYRDPRPDPSRLVYQLVGRSEEPIVEAAQRLSAQPVAGVDLNMGCAAPQIAKRGAGIAWLDDLRAAARLIERVRRAVPQEKSVSVTFRLPSDADCEKLTRLARTLERAGASFLTVHPRFRKQSYSRPARWSYVSAIAEAVSIPIYGNGDIADAETAGRRLRESGVAGLMIGRAAAQRPWIFAEMLWRRPATTESAASRESGGPPGGLPGRQPNTAPRPEAGPGMTDKGIDLAAVARRFHQLLEEMQPAEFHLSRARRFYAYFLKNLPFGYRLAAQVQQIESDEAIKHRVAGYFAEHPEYRLIRLSRGMERSHA
ncbi:MAG: tRNA dihydrouridine synthase [Spirochaetaceae bacterium]